MVTGEQLAAATKAGGNLIGNQQYLILIAERSRLSQPLRRVKTHASCTLYDWLQNQGSQLMLMVLQQTFQLGNIGGVEGGIEPGLGAWGKHLLSQHAAEQLMHAVDRVTHRHGT